MPRVVIGPALPDRASLDNEIAHLRDLDVGGFEAVGKTYSDRDRILTCPATSCFAFWRIGCKRTCWVIWMARANDCSTVRCRPRTQGNAPWSWAGVRPT